MIKNSIISSSFDEHIDLARLVFDEHASNIEKAANKISKSLSLGGTLFFCGNGGSAADSQHLAAELVGRFKNDRKALRSLALTTDSSVITCVANDYSYEEVFARQLDALGRDEDVLVVLTTSGNSPNILKVLQLAKSKSIFSLSLLGNDGGMAKDLSDLPIIIPSVSTARIQEIHGLIGHILCELIESNLGYA